jgi:hypothetical protein
MKVEDELGRAEGEKEAERESEEEERIGGE